MLFRSIKTPAQSFVDRTFIVVLGGPDMAAMRAFYANQLGMKLTEPYASPINVINDAWKLGADYATPLALVLVSPGFAVELDQYPPAATPRPVRPGDLPPAADIDLAKENERLRKENRLLMEERELLKKATVFFAGLSK